MEVKCDVKDPKGCTEKETKYIETMSAKDKDAVQKELERLKGMKVLGYRQSPDTDQIPVWPCTVATRRQKLNGCWLCRLGR